MDAIALLIALLLLGIGAVVGGLLARRQAEAQAQSALRAAEAEARVQQNVLAGQLADARAECAARSAELRSEREAGQRAEQLLRRNGDQLKEMFGAQATDALRQNAEAVVQLAEAHFAKATTAAGGDLAQRQQAIEGIVAPLRDSLQHVHEQLQAVEQGRHRSESALREQLQLMRESSTQLNVQTAQLVTALRAPQTRGRWGEMQLKRVVEAAGMLEQVDFDTQVTAAAEDGSKQRPDLVVRLTDGKVVVVDAKVPFSAYLQAMEATDEPTQAARMKAHARHLRAHVDALSAKNYQHLFASTPEFVVCFVPGDVFLDAALREEPTLLEHAFSKDIVLATPATLVALLRTISYSWRQQALAENAKQVHELGRDLYKRLCTLGNHFDKLGRSLRGSVDAYNAAVGSMEKMVLSKARQMNDLGVVDSRAEIGRLESLEAMPRTTTAPELAAPPNGRGQPRVISLPQPELPTGT